MSFGEQPDRRKGNLRVLVRSITGLRRRDLPLLAMLVVFFLLAVWARQRDALPGDVRFTRWVQGVDWPLLDSLTRATNWSMSGAPLTIIGVAVALVLLRRDQVGAVAVALALTLRLVNGVLKWIVDSPRPTDDLVGVTSGSSGLGYPSGHSSGALLVIGAMAWSLAQREERRGVRWIIWTAAIAWIALTGISRIRVGAHWPSDVLGAWLWALPALALITRIATRTQLNVPASARREPFGGARVLLAIGLVAAFAELAAAAHGPSTLPGDVRFARWVQGRDWPLLELLTDLANWSMRTVPLAIGVMLILVFLLLRDLRLEALLLLIATLLTPLSYPLKELIASPRPTPDLIHVAVESGGYGFPGGRAGNAVLIAGALAWIVTQRIESTAGRAAIWASATTWVVIAGIARIRVGAHWPSDILGAWLWTIAALLILNGIAGRIRSTR